MIWALITGYLAVGAVISAMTVSQPEIQEKVAETVNKTAETHGSPLQDQTQAVYWIVLAGFAVVAMITWPKIAYDTWKSHR